MGKTPRPPDDEPKIPEAMRPVYQTIVDSTDAFCRKHLDEEYAILSRRLAGVLARKRPSPLTKGKPASWAAGIVRVIGWVNFIGDPSQPNSMKLSDIDRGIGVSEATGNAKSMEIRNLLKIHRLDPEWTLPSKMDQNLLVWLVEVNGFPIDVRMAPSEIQEEALRLGLIPYLPGESAGHA